MITLTVQQIQSPTWITLKSQLLQRIEELHLRLEKAADHDSTQATRGEIRAIRGILIAGEPSPEVPKDLTQF